VAQGGWNMPLVYLMDKAKEYRDSYARSGVTDVATLEAIYVSHLAWLINDVIRKSRERENNG
jgi:hypothetical protein